MSKPENPRVEPVRTPSEEPAGAVTTQDRCTSQENSNMEMRERGNTPSGAGGPEGPREEISSERMWRLYDGFYAAPEFVRREVERLLTTDPGELRAGFSKKDTIPRDSRPSKRTASQAFDDADSNLESSPPAIAQETMSKRSRQQDPTTAHDPGDDDIRPSSPVEQSAREPGTVFTPENAQTSRGGDPNKEISSSTEMPSAALLVQNADNSTAKLAPKETLSTSAANVEKPGASREPPSTMTKEFTFSLTKSPAPAKVISNTAYDKMVAVAGQACADIEHHSMFAAAFKKTEVTAESEGVVETPSREEAVPASEASHRPAAPSKRWPEVTKGLNTSRKASLLDRQTWGMKGQRLFTDEPPTPLLGPEEPHK